jgi:hypothetical protein
MTDGPVGLVERDQRHPSAAHLQVRIHSSDHESSTTRVLREDDRWPDPVSGVGNR